MNLEAFITYSMPLLLDDLLYIVQDVEVYSCHHLHILHPSSLILSYVIPCSAQVTQMRLVESAEFHRLILPVVDGVILSEM